MRWNGKTIRKSILAGAVAAAVGTAAWAAGQPDAASQDPLLENPAESSRVPAENFSALDTNLDGVLSQDEAQDSQVLQGRFSDADANRDGSIDKSEFAAYELLRQNGELEEAPPALSPEGAEGPDQLMDADVPPTEEAARNMEQSAGEPEDAADAPFAMLDADGDGRLSPQEAERSPSLAQGFEAADQDNDGSISRSEFSAFEEQGSREPTTDDPQSSGGLEWENQAEAGRFQQLDRNGDGVISLEESENAPNLGDQFSEADTDLDGRIDRGEFAAFELEQSVQPPEMPGAGGEPIIEQPAPEE